MSTFNELSKSTKTILWTARIISTLVLAFVMFFVIAHIFGKDESGEGLRSFGEVVQFICFPVSTVIGLSLAFKFEGLGGMITVVGMVILFILRPDLIISPMTVMIIPGLLFIIYWYLAKRKSNQSEV